MQRRGFLLGQKNGLRGSIIILGRIFASTSFIFINMERLLILRYLPVSSHKMSWHLISNSIGGQSNHVASSASQLLQPTLQLRSASLSRKRPTNPIQTRRSNPPNSTGTTQPPKWFSKPIFPSPRRVQHGSNGSFPRVSKSKSLSRRQGYSSRSRTQRRSSHAPRYLEL